MTDERAFDTEDLTSPQNRSSHGVTLIRFRHILKHLQTRHFLGASAIINFVWFVPVTGEAAKRSDHCNKTVDIYEDVTSPEVTPETFGRPMTCWYRFRSFRGTPRDWILRIRFKKFKVGTLVNATTCLGGYMQVKFKKINYLKKI